MKKLFKMISVLLALAMLLSFAGCGPKTPADPTDSNPADPTNPAANDEFAAIAGEYELDGADLGMPIKWYIKITADGKFVISTNRNYTTLKGEGSVGGKDGTYMFMYADSTQENPKTATFTVEGKNLVFSTRVPIGSAGVDANHEEGKYPTAKLIACEDILGSYLGEYEKVSAMAGTVLYSYELVLDYGLEYTFSSSFSMDGSIYTRVEIGNFAVNGSEISFTATEVDGEAVEAPATLNGTIADQTIKAPFKLSKMASEPQEVEARLGVYAEYAGTYAGLYEKAMGPVVLSYKTVLKLDAFGGYQFSTISTAEGEVDYTEEGTYTVADGKFAFTSNAEGAAAVEGTLANYVMNVKFPISSMVPNAVDLALYAEEVSGEFSCTGVVNDKNYVAHLVLQGNNFVLTVGEEGAETPAYVAKGTFEIQKAMNTNVVLTTVELLAGDGTAVEIPAELATVSAPVAESGINANLLFDLDDAAVVGFQLEKVA